MSEDLHPSVKEFKQFVQDHPLLVQEVKQNGGSWQTYYEKWMLLGANDPSWDTYKNITNAASNSAEQEQKAEASDNKEIFSKVMSMANQVDFDKIQGHIHQLNGAIANIQQLIGQYQEAKRHLPVKKTKSTSFFHKD